MPIGVTSNFTGEYDKKTLAMTKPRVARLTLRIVSVPGPYFTTGKRTHCVRHQALGRDFYRFLSYEARVKIEKFYYVTPRLTPK
jgi:hypothetical protein